MDIKGIAAFFSVVLSLISLVFAESAKRQTIALSKQEFQTETALNLLQNAYKEMTDNTEATNQARDKRFFTCFFVRALEEAEQDAKGNKEPFIVKSFVSRARAAGVWSQTCDALNDPTGKAAVANETIESWQTMIASYQVDDSGCENARADVVEFTRLLNGSTLARGRELRVLRTGQNGHYVVSVDMGEDNKEAWALSEQIIKLSPDTVDQKTGRDSYVKRAVGWYEDEACK